MWFRSSPTPRPALRVEPSGAVLTSRFDSSLRRRGGALLRIAAASRSAAWVARLASCYGIAGACSPTAATKRWRYLRRLVTSETLLLELVDQLVVLLPCQVGTMPLLSVRQRPDAASSPSAQRD